MNQNFYLPLSRAFQNEFDQAAGTGAFNFVEFHNRIEPLFQRLGFREPQKHGVENILIIRLDVMGDFIMTSGFIRELRTNYPFARITLLVSDYIYPLAELCPYVNEVLHFDPQTNEGIMQLLKKTAEFASDQLWHRHFSMSFCVQPRGYKLPSIFMSYFSGAAERIGYIYPERQSDLIKLFLNRALPLPTDIVHEALLPLHVLSSIGLRVQSTDLELWYDAEDILTVRQLLKDVSPDKILIAVGLGSGEGNRKYPVKQYLTAFREILSRSKRETLMIIGGKKELNDARFMQENLPSDRIINLVDKLSLRGTAAAITMSDIYIGNATGVMHMAAAAHVPVITVYREARDRGDRMVSISQITEYYQFAPYQTLSVALRPDTPLGECKQLTIGCKESTSHCIAQVPPDEIVRAYSAIRYILWNKPPKHEKYSVCNRSHVAIIRRSQQRLNMHY